MEGFSWTASFTTLAVLAGWVASIGALVWKRSGAETETRLALAEAKTKIAEIASKWTVEQTAAEQRARELEANRQRWREDMEKMIDQRLSGVIGAHNLLREQHQEMRENIALNYMTKPEIAAIEERVTNNQDRIITRLERLDERIGTMHDAVMKALSTR